MMMTKITTAYKDIRNYKVVTHCRPTEWREQLMTSLQTLRQIIPNSERDPRSIYSSKPHEWHRSHRSWNRGAAISLEGCRHHLCLPHDAASLAMHSTHPHKSPLHWSACESLVPTHLHKSNSGLLLVAHGSRSCCCYSSSLHGHKSLAHPTHCCIRLLQHWLTSHSDRVTGRGIPGFESMGSVQRRWQGLDCSSRSAVLAPLLPHSVACGWSDRSPFAEASSWCANATSSWSHCLFFPAIETQFVTTWNHKLDSDRFDAHASSSEHASVATCCPELDAVQWSNLLLPGKSFPSWGLASSSWSTSVCNSFHTVVVLQEERRTHWTWCHWRGSKW